MAKKYVSRVTVLIDGAKQDHLKNFKAHPQDYRGSFKLMDGMGTYDTVKEHKFALDYAIPKAGAKIDWSDIEDATVIVNLKGGKSMIFSGTDSLGRGEITVDGEKESVFTIEFAAEDSTIQ